jgi:hypothetical protein
MNELSVTKPYQSRIEAIINTIGLGLGKHGWMRLGTYF